MFIRFDPGLLSIRTRMSVFNAPYPIPTFPLKGGRSRFPPPLRGRAITSDLAIVFG
jgi:hypothetical protein